METTSSSTRPRDEPRPEQAAGDAARSSVRATPAAADAHHGHGADEALRRRVLWRLLAVFLAAAATTVLSYGLTVGTALGQLMGELILGGRAGSPEAIAAAERILGQLSRGVFVAGTVTVMALALLQRRFGLAVAAGAIVLLANLTTQLLKHALLERPDLLDGMFYVLPNSFPSGHATATAAVAVALVMVLPPVLRGPAVLLSALVVALVGASTLLAGWHRMADAVGGVFVATAWGALVTGILVARHRVEPVGGRTAALGRLSARIPIVAGVAVLLVGSAAYLLALADPLGVLVDLAERGGSPALLVVGILITTGTSFLALGAFGLAIRDVRLDPLRRVVRPRSARP